MNEWCVILDGALHWLGKLGSVRVGGLVRSRGGDVGLGGRSGGRRDGWRGSKSRVRRVVDRVRTWVVGKGSWVARKGRWAGERRERAKNWRSRVSPRKSSIVPAHQSRFKRRDCCIQLQID